MNENTAFAIIVVAICAALAAMAIWAPACDGGHLSSCPEQQVIGNITDCSQCP